MFEPWFDPLSLGFRRENMKTKGQTKNTEDERTSDEGHPIATNLKSSRFQHCSLARDEPQIGFVCLFCM